MSKKGISCCINFIDLVIFLSATVFAEETITAKLKSYTAYEYPYLMLEHVMGPERTVYYAICYNSEGQVEYGEIIREIDDFVLSRVYLDGTSEDFEPPQLTIQQIGSLQKNILNMNMIFAIGL